jgi:hypothetical protein
MIRSESSALKNSSERFWFYLGLSILVFAYLPGVLTTSFYSDDFVALSDPKLMADTLISDARPVWGFWNLFLFEWVSRYSLFILPKVIGLAGIIVLYIYMAKILKQNNQEKSHYVIVSLAMLLPSFSIWAHWSISSLHSWGAILGLHSYFMYKQRRYPLSIFEMAIACLIYPPSALFFVGFVFYLDVISKSNVREMLNNFIRALKIITLGVLFSIVSAALVIEFSNVPASQRVGLVEIDKIIAKVIWFYTHPFVLGFYPGSVQSPGLLRLMIFVIPTSLLALYAISISATKLRVDFLGRVGIFLLVCNLTIIPLLFTRDNQIELRLIPGLAWIVFTLALYGFSQILLVHRKSLTFFFQGSLFVGLLSLLIFGVHQRFNDFYHFQYVNSSQFITTELKDCIQKNSIAKIAVVPDAKSFPTFQNLGTFSSSSDMMSPWVPVNKIKFLLKKDFGLNSEVSFGVNTDTGSNCTIKISDYGLSLKKRNFSSLM